jgi:hypothetical protein
MLFANKGLRFVPIADSLFDDHLKTIKQEEKEQQTRAKAREKQVSAARKKSRK